MNDDKDDADGDGNDYNEINVDYLSLYSPVPLKRGPI